MANDLDLLERARELLTRGRPARAAALLDRSWPPAISAEAARLRADALRQQGYFDRAIALYRAPLSRPPAQDPGAWAEAALGLSSALRSVGRGREARSWVARGLSAARSRAMAELAQDLELESLMLDRAEERYDAVLPRLRALARRALAAGDAAKAAYLLWAAAGAERFAGRLKASEETFRRSLALARRAGDAAGEAYALFGLGGISRILGRLKDSERWYREAGRRLRGGDDVFGRAYAECGLANALRQLGRLKEARAGYERAHRLYSTLGDPLDLAYVDWGLGKIELQEGRLRAAESRLRRALAAFARGGETRGVVLSRLALAQALHAAGRTREAEKHFASGVALARRKGSHAHLESFT